MYECGHFVEAELAHLFLVSIVYMDTLENASASHQTDLLSNL